MFNSLFVFPLYSSLSCLSHACLSLSLELSWEPPCLSFWTINKSSLFFLHFFTYKEANSCTTSALFLEEYIPSCYSLCLTRHHFSRYYHASHTGHYFLSYNVITHSFHDCIYTRHWNTVTWESTQPFPLYNQPHISHALPRRASSFRYVLEEISFQ